MEDMSSTFVKGCCVRNLVLRSVFATLRDPEGADTMGRVNKSRKAYVTGGVIMNIYPYAPLPSVHRTDTAFASN